MPRQFIGDFVTGRIAQHGQHAFDQRLLLDQLVLCFTRQVRRRQLSFHLHKSIFRFLQVILPLLARRSLELGNVLVGRLDLVLPHKSIPDRLVKGQRDPPHQLPLLCIARVKRKPGIDRSGETDVSRRDALPQHAADDAIRVGLVFRRPLGLNLSRNDQQQDNYQRRELRCALSNLRIVSVPAGSSRMTGLACPPSKERIAPSIPPTAERRQRSPNCSTALAAR